MLVSWKWLSRYLNLPVSHEALALRLSLSGLNHESTEIVDGDPVIDLEVTSNRGDCLGHLGVAREIAVLYGLEICRPEPGLASVTDPTQSIESLLQVENEFVDACPRYTARVIRGVKVGPSPAWMVQSLAAVGIASINNVVDATNYVMMECGQPLHAFDYAKLDGQRIRIRPASEGESIEAIDHRNYLLEPSMCVIADSRSAVAVAGVMGGASSEVTETTRDLVIEAAIFTPLSVRRTARALKLHSPSSYRFERRVDPEQVDWANRRVCQLIIESAGGKVASGVIDTHTMPRDAKPLVLRASQIERVLGISIDADEVARILTALGCQSTASSPGEMHFTPPSWRHDLTREVDLIEEVARIHGYDKIPEDSPIPVAPSARRPYDVGVDQVRSVMTAAGLSEAMTPSVVVERLDEAMSPWTDRPALQTQTPMLEGSRRLRRSLLPSLLNSRAANWASSTTEANLYEIAHVYLPGETDEALPDEHYTVGMIAGGDFYRLKGIIETIFARLGIDAPMQLTSVDRPGLGRGTAVEIRMQGHLVGYLAAVDAKLLKSFKLPGPVFVAEVSLPTLFAMATLVPQQRFVSPFPSVERDLNFVVAEAIRWSEMERVVRTSVGTDLARVTYRETYRDPKKDGDDRKRVLMTVELRRDDETLSGDQADAMITKLINDCRESLAAELLS